MDASPSPSPSPPPRTAERLKKRGRVESAHLDGELLSAAGGPQASGSLAQLLPLGRHALVSRSRRGLPRSQSAPTLHCKVRTSSSCCCMLPVLVALLQKE